MMTKNIRKTFLDIKVKRMTEKNQNWIGVVLGAVGSGKTYFALQCANEMMKNMDPDIHVVFTIEEFMNKFNNKTFKKADVIVFEEAGVNISSKNWQSKANKNINFVLQTCRHRNFAIIFTLPMFKFLDASTRALIHTTFVTDEIDYKKEIAYCRVYDLKTDALRGKEPWTISPKFWVDGRVVVMKRIAMKLPTENILKVYEKRKTAFTDKLNKEIEDLLNADVIEKEIKIKKVYCPDCNGSNWLFHKKTNDWECRKCGKVIKENPFKRDE